MNLKQSISWKIALPVGIILFAIGYGGVIGLLGFILGAFGIVGLIIDLIKSKRETK